MSRNKNHELIMQSIYIELTYIAMKEEVNIPLIMEGVFNTPFNKIDLFSRGVVIKANRYLDEIVNRLSQTLKGWKWERISRLAQAILIMSCAHYYYVEKVDKAIVIEVAVKLAKKYLDQNEPKFINGVLDKVL
ncbi:MAG: transcription antitermination factor NusB [Bacilli bacterium]|nr:transcription antitermination factor NusB [Bacilli bacterium]